MKRDSNGRIILDDLVPTNNYVEGRKSKIWLRDNNDLYMFKADAINYELYAELIASELAKQIGLDAAEYDLATYKNTSGIVTKSFLKENELIISGKDILNDGAKIAKKNNLSITVGFNALNCIITSLSLKYNFANVDEIITALIKMWCFDILILESDRNETNWSIISNKNGIRLAPIYDCSTMAFLNNDITTYLNKMYSYDAIARLLDSAKLSMAYKMELQDHPVLEQFAILCRENIDFVKPIIASISRIDVDLAIKSIEKRHNTDKQGEIPFEIPPSVAIWVSKVIEFRKKDLIGIYNYESQKIEELKR